MPASGQWKASDGGRHHHELMDHMMQKLGVDVLVAIGLEEGQGFIKARSTCRRCPHEGACRLWLAAAPRTPVPPDFCPNSGFFRKCGLLGSYGLWRERRSN